MGVCGFVYAEEGTCSLSSECVTVIQHKQQFKKNKYKEVGWHTEEAHLNLYIFQLVQQERIILCAGIGILRMNNLHAFKDSCFIKTYA